MGIVIGLLVLVCWAAGAVVWMMEPAERAKLAERLAMKWRQTEVDDEEDKAVLAHERLRQEMKKGTRRES
jgi:hypothetical protein